MSETLTTVERAFQLAHAGKCRTVDDIRKALKSEGFDAVDAHIRGSLAKQLKAILKKAE